MTAAQAETNATWLMVELVDGSLVCVIINLRTSAQPPQHRTQADTGPRMKAEAPLGQTGHNGQEARFDCLHCKVGTEVE